MTEINEVHCKVFVGFGGSGGKTLRELARMFAADQELAGRSESEAYFLLVDTDQGDLNNLQRDIVRTFAAVGEHPFVKTISLAQGVTRMDTAILSAMKPAMDAAKKKSDKGLKRMRSVWWFNERDKPFIARNVQSPPSQGASQCPAISHFLGWKAMQGADSLIGQAVAELCEEMRGRVSEHHSAERSTRVSLNLVAGLAGGTGRGSWASLSMRIQQELRDHGYESRATGVFFDQSCYEDIQDGGQGQRTKMIVNSLTGVSELGGWIDNDLNRDDRKGKRYFLRLPSFASPERASSDVINARELLSPIDDEGATAGASPVTKAYLVFANGRAGRLEHGKHYQLAAAALYGMTSESIIQSEESNERVYLGSLGASSFRVDVDGIREYLMDRVEHRCIRGLVDEGSRPKRASAGKASDEAKRVVEAILRPLLVDRTEKNATAVPEGAAKNQPSLLARLQAEWQRQAKGRIKGFLEDLPDWDKGEYEEKLKRFANKVTKGSDFEAAVTSALRGSITHVFGAGMLSDQAESGGALVLEQFLRKALTSSIEDPNANTVSGSMDEARLDHHVRSFVINRQVIDLLDRRLGEVQARIEEVTSGGPTVGQVLAEVNEASRKKFFIAGERFDDGEKEDLRDTLRELVLSEGRKKLQPLMEKWVTPIRRQLVNWKKNLDYAVDAAQKHASDIERSKLTQNRTENVFTTPRELREQRRKPKAHRTFFRPTRYLEPFAEDSSFETWAEDLQRSSDSRLRDALRGIQTAVLEGAMTNGVRGRGEQREAERDLYRRLEGFREDVIIDREWLARNFSLMTVAKQLVDAYANAIEDCKASPRQQGYLEDHFLRTFGFGIERDRGRLDVPDAESIMIQMAIELGENCKAQYRVKAGVEGLERKASHVFLPADEKLAMDKPAADKLRGKCDKLARRRKAKVNFHVEECLTVDGDVSEERGNPFLMLSVVTEGFLMANDEDGSSPTGAAHEAFGHVTSLDYYDAGGDHKVKQYLEWVERPDGKSWFKDDKETFGLGYTLPAFVHHQGLREARWRPWAKDVDQEIARQASASIDAMLYAMLGVPGKRDGMIFQVRLLDRPVVWRLPLLKLVAGSKFSFSRKAFTIENTGEWEANSEAFLPDDAPMSIAQLHDRLRQEPDIQSAIATEAAYFFDVLCDGEDRPGDGAVKQAFKDLWTWVSDTLKPTLQKRGDELYEREYESLVEQLADRAKVLLKMKRKDLAALYRGV